LGNGGTDQVRDGELFRAFAIGVAVQPLGRLTPSHLVCSLCAAALNDRKPPTAAPDYQESSQTARRTIALFVIY
jgi:hypothetical protein